MDVVNVEKTNNNNLNVCTYLKKFHLKNVLFKPKEQEK